MHVSFDSWPNFVFFIPPLHIACFWMNSFVFSFWIRLSWARRCPIIILCRLDYRIFHFDIRLFVRTPSNHSNICHFDKLLPFKQSSPLCRCVASTSSMERRKMRLTLDHWPSTVDHRPSAIVEWPGHPPWTIITNNKLFSIVFLWIVIDSLQCRWWISANAFWTIRKWAPTPLKWNYFVARRLPFPPLEI